VTGVAWASGPHAWGRFRNPTLIGRPAEPFLARTFARTRRHPALIAIDLGTLVAFSEAPTGRGCERGRHGDAGAAPALCRAFLAEYAAAVAAQRLDRSPLREWSSDAVLTGPAASALPDTAAGRILFACRLVLIPRGIGGVGVGETFWRVGGQAPLEPREVPLGIAPCLRVGWCRPGWIVDAASIADEQAVLLGGVRLSGGVGDAHAGRRLRADRTSAGDLDVLARAGLALVLVVGSALVLFGAGLFWGGL